LQQIESLIRSGAPREALQRSVEWFEPERTPAWLEADLCNLAGAAAHALASFDIAAEMWLRATKCADPHGAIQPWFNLAQLRLQQDRAADAEHALWQVLRLAPAHADAAARLGQLLAAQRRQAEARSCYERALRADPRHRVAQANLAVLLAETGEPEQAQAAYAKALELDPLNPTVHTNLGVLLAATRRPELALACHQRAIELDAANAAAHSNLGLVLVALHRDTEALEHQMRALALAPRSAQIHTNLGNVLARIGREPEAEHHLRQAVDSEPDNAAFHLNLGVLLADQGRDEEAERHLRRALSLRPGHALARLDLSCLLLAQGRFDEGWPMHEARHDPSLPDCGISPPNVELPCWSGESLAGKSLLIWPEQGLGDQIQFCRFVPALKSLGARHVTLACQRPLERLFESLPGVDRVVGADVVNNAFHAEPAALADHDYWTFPLSLARQLGVRESNLPGAPIPYLSARSDHVLDWTRRQRLDAKQHGTDLRVGLVWRGNPMHNNDAERSVADLQTLAPLWSVRAVRWVSLQTGAPAARVTESGTPGPWLALGPQLGDFADTAAALRTLDLLISVDTSIVHLAGAMGMDCWVMLPHRKTDWRWLRDREDTPWYPVGMRLFRQTKRGDWSGVVARLVEALRARVALRGVDRGKD